MTPQSWSFENDEEGLRGIEREQWLIRDLDTDNHDIIAVVPKTGDEQYDDRVTYPNVKLLTAAKRLLEMCEQMRDRITILFNERDLCWHDWSTAYEVDEAIALAGGEPFDKEPEE